MKKFLLLVVGASCLLLITACSNSSSDNAEGSKLIQVEVKPVQETLQPGRAILIDAHVTQGSENVTDAQEVKFEIWKKDEEQHKTITAAHWQDGVYRIKTIFPGDGTYYVIAHVTARDMHVMPQKELIVGG
ncbi:FixH family protein [Paenibacillus mendelii]|uniref:FixH family protein n=1 Tax=Paenibacillus mendelii TaxID=206163 RepID=A0ABV6J5L4_9BACL|nr:FixH family protein [Paenibacillus mendelii]MCQ6560231.1 FixH family protein [Paenibacillus mendelii]